MDTFQGVSLPSRIADDLSIVISALHPVVVSALHPVVVSAVRPVAVSAVRPVAVSVAHPFVAAADTDPADPAVRAACGDEPTFVCEQAFDLSDGSEGLARSADWLIDRPLSIVLIVTFAWILLRVARRVLDRFVHRIVVSDRQAARRRLHALGIDRTERLLGPEADDPRLAARRESRAASISNVITSTLTIAVWTIAVIMVIGELGLDLAPLIAGAGIGGVALGFGAQSLVKDFISGLFILMEDQYGIGDVIDLGEAVGTVEEVALRTTVLRGLDGTVWHVPNGEIKRVGNKSQHWSTAVVDVDVAYDADLAKVRGIIEETSRRVCTSQDWRDHVLDEPQVLGVETLGADGITIRMTVQTAPGQQWALQRTLREALKVGLDDAGVEIPFPQRTLWLRNQDG